ncbi:MAG TPA: hypothetical protein VMI72_12270, partial [Roseiarcus sp.]|nr:hypothetical protein [Roseiarcus sp.]
TVEAHRRAAAKFPAFISALAAWLSSLAATLLEVGEPNDEALAAAQEAVEVLNPSFLNSPTEHADSMSTSLVQYLDLAESLGVEPDEALIGPIEDALKAIDASSVERTENNAQLR